MPLQINFVANNPPKGEIKLIKKIVERENPEKKFIGSSKFMPVPPSSIVISELSASGATLSWSGDRHARSYEYKIYSSTSSDMSSSLTEVYLKRSAVSGQSVSFVPTAGLYYGVSVTVRNEHLYKESAISSGVLYSLTSSLTAPTSVTLSSLTGTGATVSWSGGSGATSYRVQIYYNSSSSVTTSNSQVTQSPYLSVSSGSTFNFTATDITYYAATVTAIDLDGEATSSISSAVQYFVAPGQATANTPTNTGTTLNITWNAPASGGSSITSYTVYVLANGSAASTLTPGLVTSTTFSPMISGTAYTFYVVANGNGGSGTQSTTSSGVTYYAAPGQVTGNTPTNNGTTLNISWSAASGSVTAYTVYVLAAGSLAPSGTLSLGNVTSTTFSPMVSGTAYSFYVVATGPGGSGTQSTTTSTVTYTPPPGQATVETPTNTGTTLNMTWAAPGSGEAVTGYIVYVLAAGSLAPSGTLSLGNVTSTTFSPMVSGTAYSFYVVATGVGGSGTQSTTSSAVTYTAAPLAPTSVTLSILTETGATVTWSGGSGATSYTVQIYSSASSNMSSRSTVSQTPSSSTTVTSPQAFTFTASSGLYYGAIVTAVNSGGSTASSISSGVLYDSSELTAATTVTIVSVTLSGVTVTWSGDTGATSYTCQIYSSTESNMSSPMTISQSPNSSSSVLPWELFYISVQDSLYYAAIVTAVNATGSIASSMSSSVQFNNVYSGTTSVSTVASGFTALYGLAIDSSENMYLADYAGHKIWYIPSGGSPSILAGSTTGLVNGDVSVAKFNGPSGVAVNAAGTVVYVSDYGNGKVRMITGGTVTTLAGATQGAFLDGASNVARFNQPSGIALDRTETVLFIGDKLTHRIRLVTIATGAVTTLAGSGTAAWGDGTGASASFNQPLGLCVGPDNSVYVADSANQRIRKVTYPGGVVTTLAGDGTRAFLNGTGSGARFNNPYGVGMDAYGILYVADKDNRRIRKITGAGVVTTFAGSGTNTNVDNANALLATFTQPTGVIVNSSGNALYVTHVATSAVRKITFNSYTVVPVAPTIVSIVSLIATGATVSWSGGSGATSYTLQIYSSSSSDMSSPSTVSQTPLSGISIISPQAFTFTAVDTLYYGAIVTAVNIIGSTDSSMSTSFLYRIPVAPTSIILSPLIGTGASISWSGDSGAITYRVQIYSSSSSDMSSPSTVSQTPSSSTSITSSPQLFTYTATNSLYYGAIVTTVNRSGSAASSISTGVLYTGSSSALAPTTVTITSMTTSTATVTWSGSSGADSYTCQIYSSTQSNMSSPTTISQNPSASTSVSSGQVFNIVPQDSLYYAAIVTAVSTSGSESSISTGFQFSGVYTGTLQLGEYSSTASFTTPRGMAFDSNGNMYVVDAGGRKVWVIPPGGGDPSIFVGPSASTTGYIDANGTDARFNEISGVAIDSNNNLYVTDYGNCCIRKITPNGDVSTFTGSASTSGQTGVGAGGYVDGPSNVAEFWYPYGIVTDTSKSVLFVSEYNTHYIRIVSLADGSVTTFAGGYLSVVNSRAPDYWNDGTGLGASFASPQGMCIDQFNNIYVADTENNRIRKITYPGGVVTTIAGNTAAAFANGTGSDARFNSPCGLAIDANGVLYVADRGNNRIRQITGAGVVTTFAGSGTSGTTNNANPLLATYSNIGGILIDSQRTLYISHAGASGAINKGIRKITMA
jgi:sugar lactone lactonase YvrE